MLAHFRLFGLVSAGRDRGSAHFEAEAFGRHLDFYCDAFDRFSPGIALRLAVTGESLLAAAKAFAARREIQFAPEERDAADSYYAGFCFHLYARRADGGWRQLVDGGLVNWGARLTGNAKERMMISGAGLEGVIAHRAEMSAG